MGFDVVLADPPWDYYGSPTKWAAAGKFYPLMSDDQMLAFPMCSYMNKPAILFMWTTSSKLAFAISCITQWKLHYRGMAFVWIKTRKNGTAIKAQGVRPSITKPLTEYVICASNVVRGRPLKLHDESVCQTIFQPVSEHSRKPDDVHERLERMYPDQSKIELFARRERAGWTTWGNEVSP